jgi:hypothetical protein
MKKFLLFAVSLIAAVTGFAQPENRVFTITNETYANLPNPTVITTQGWDDFSAKVPLGFHFSMMGITTDTMYFDDQVNLGADMQMTTTAPTHLLVFLTDFKDRSDMPGKPVSTVSYQNFITGTPSVTKIQWKDAGFFGEEDNNGTLNDSVNFQVWLREFSNDVEVHFGPSKITSSYMDIFNFALPFFGFAKNADLNNFTLDYLYYVSATSPAPKVDSIDMIGLAGTSSLGYSAWPANGTVFKFSKPASGGVNGVQLNEYAQVAPTLVTDECVVTLSKPGFEGTISLIDMNGRFVRSQQAVNGKNILDMGSLVPGNYMLHIRSKEASVFYKITKQ